MSSDPDVNIAVFVDFDNVAIGAEDESLAPFRIDPVQHRLLDKGNVIVKRAYGDWARFRAHKREMHSAGYELIDVPPSGMSGKNSADIKLVVDAIDLCHTKPHVHLFAIISGDSDFSPLVAKLRENNKGVLGVGVRASTSSLLVNGCDEFIYYDDLVAPAKADATTDEALDLVIDTAEALLREREQPVWGSHIKQVIKRKKPNFDESHFGYRSFSRLLEDASRRELLSIHRDSTSGGYKVVSVAR